MTAKCMPGCILTEPHAGLCQTSVALQTTHHDKCWRYHKDCELERLRQIADDLCAIEWRYSDPTINERIALKEAIQRAKELRS